MDTPALNNRGFYKSMLAMALPIALQNLLSASSNLVDTAMVTRLGDLNIAAVGVAGRWSFFMHLILFGLASGSSVLISQYWGIKDVKNIKKTYGIGLVLGLTVTACYVAICLLIPEKLAAVYSSDADLIPLAADYLRIVALGMIPQAYAFITSIARRATEDVRIPVMGACAATCTNIFLNWVLIYGNLGAPALGLRGAAIATAVSMYAHMLVHMTASWRQKHFTFVPPGQLFGFERAYLGKYLRIAWPVLINEIIWATGMNLYVMVFARQGITNYAGYTVFNSVQELGFIFFVGICSACAVMVGKAVGSGKPKEAYAIGKRFLIITPLLGVVVGAILVLIRNPALNLMGIETAQARSVAESLLLFYSGWVGIRNISYTAVVGIFRAGGDTKMGFFLDCVIMFAVAVPIVAALGFFTDIPFVWLVVAMYLAEDAPKTFICLWYFRSKKWIRQLTQAGNNAESA